MKISVLAVILIIISFIFYNEMTKHHYNISSIIEESNNEENNIYNGNYIVSDNNVIVENSYDFDNSIETKEIRYRRYLNRDNEPYDVDFGEASEDLFSRLVIIFFIGCAIIGILAEMLFFKNYSYKFYLIAFAVILIVSLAIIYKIHGNMAIFNMNGSIESMIELLAFFSGGILSFIALRISKYLRDKDKNKNE
ncbi:hypothetical protein A966_05803 [Brachyspira hampsonii 30446]|uniref:Uncharacterized protein n=1 Tax=Brachyspira hampsonii 30446 TaxID=1289135 RepID=A0A2U4FCZ8_9SPIR|nr:hypothetical protein [Brachyspira hampsonii]EKV57364.1 hypothetical protein A966_05803 [Brachyspira hampsonii 30446]MBW5396110.1 hypothetical protein [Brachyspira hampsonii]OEJ19037.1 hypothetical protein A9495_00370 [Brachyspira hampsonii]